MARIAQTAVCNRFHVVETCLAHGLLLIRDRIGSDHFRLTHDFLGHIPGVRRVGVTKVAHALNQRQLVDYDRGNIAIINKSGLEAVSCSCYEMVKEGAR